jgi:uncharacterized membrane protein (DUF2068 family)
MQALGIKLIAVLHWLRALVYIAGGLAILGVTHLSSRMISAVANDTPLDRLTSGVGNTIAIGALLFALFWIVLGVGVWTTKNWARVLTLVFAGLWLLFGLMKVAHFPTPWHLLRVAVDAAIIFYLLLPDVKREFRATA